MIREEIRSLAEYRLRQQPCRVKLNQNENPFELPHEVKEEILRRLGSARWSRYPAFVPQEQIDRVAAFAGWRPDGTLLGNGSNDLLQLLFTSVLERGTPAVISQPTFTLYKLLARSLAADLQEVPMQSDFTFDVGRIIDVSRKTSARLVVLCAPNNPTGTPLTRDEVVEILRSIPGLLVLDEAYVQFAPESHAALLREFDNLVILQTFSKAMGAAGLRFGYALCPPGLARDLNKVKLPYSVNIFTLIAAEVIVDRWPEIRGWIRILVREREALIKALSEQGTLKVYPSSANFALVETLRKKPVEVFEGLLERGILIRDVSSYPMLERGLRITVGTPEENKELVSALKEVA